jgi:hypothetical protein
MAGWISLLSFGATTVYFAQVISATIHGAAAQTRLFTGSDLAVRMLSLATQVLATAAFFKRFGIPQRCLLAVKHTYCFNMGVWLQPAEGVEFITANGLWAAALIA